MSLLDWCMKNPFYTSLALFSTVEERSVPFLKGFLTLNCSKCTRGVVHHTGKARGELLMSESPPEALTTLKTPLWPSAQIPHRALGSVEPWSQGQAQGCLAGAQHSRGSACGWIPSLQGIWEGSV